MKRLWQKIKTSNAIRALELWDSSGRFDMAFLSAARSIAASADHRIVYPVPKQDAETDPKNIKVGFFGNICNNSYIQVKCLRDLGYQAEVVIDNRHDTHPFSHPSWEDLDIEVTSLDEAKSYAEQWTKPDFVRDVYFDEDLNQHFREERFRAVPEIQAMYKEAFGIPLTPDRALFLSQFMGYWPYLLEMARYDVVVFFGPQVFLGVFCARPYVARPAGIDLYYHAFEENEFGFGVRASLRRAARILRRQKVHTEYHRRLGTEHLVKYAPDLCDMETYSPGSAPDVRRRWHEAVGGELFVYCPNGQDWFWRAHDRLFEAFATLDHPDMRLVVGDWGKDIEKSRALARNLNIADRIVWDSIASQPVLIDRYRAADIVVDKFVLDAYGATVLEALSVGKPVVSRFVKDSSEGTGFTRPPIVNAVTVDEIATALRELSDPAKREEIGAASRDWAVASRCHRRHGPVFMDDLLEIVNAWSVPAFDD